MRADGAKALTTAHERARTAKERFIAQDIVFGKVNLARINEREKKKTNKIYFGLYLGQVFSVGFLLSTTRF